MACLRVSETVRIEREIERDIESLLLTRERVVGSENCC